MRLRGKQVIFDETFRPDKAGEIFGVYRNVSRPVRLTEADHGRGVRAHPHARDPDDRAFGVRLAFLCL